MAKSFLMRFPVGGVDQSQNASLISPSAIADGVNCVIKDSMIGCRPGVVLHDLGLTCDDHIQGAIFYNPSEGQSQQVFGDESSSMVLAAAGKKYHVKVTDAHPQNTKVEVADVTGEGLETNPVYHLVWMIQAENYVIAEDGNGETWIWDGTSEPFFSPGYNTEDKEESKLASAASMLAYAHGRVVQVVGRNKILVGDIIHKKNLGSSENILDTTEQVYWATGSFFSPPSGMGPVQAMALLPLQNTQHGHADLIIHCRNGAFSLDVSQYPRSTWSEKALSKHVLLDTGAVGFYGVVGFDGDQIFMSRHGVQSLRSEASVNKIGNAFEPLSLQVRDYIDSDNKKNLSFVSMTKSIDWSRMFTTTSHMVVDSTHRGGRGILTLNFQPKAKAQFYSWEGLWTLPPEGYLVGNMLRGVFGQRERVFAFVTGSDKVPRLAEFSKDLPYDVLPDGTLKKIEWQVMTRSDTLGDETTSKDVTNGLVVFRNVVGELSFKAYVRTNQTDWSLWDEGCLNAGDECCLVPGAIKDFRYDLGAPPEEASKCLWMQVLIVSEGAGFIESIRVKSSPNPAGENRPSDSGCHLLSVTNCDDTFNPFSYTLEP